MLRRRKRTDDFINVLKTKKLYATISNPLPQLCAALSHETLIKMPGSFVTKRVWTRSVLPWFWAKCGPPLSWLWLWWAVLGWPVTDEGRRNGRDPPTWGFWGCCCAGRFML